MQTLDPNLKSIRVEGLYLALSWIHKLKSNLEF